MSRPPIDSTTVKTSRQPRAHDAVSGTTRCLLGNGAVHTRLAAGRMKVPILKEVAIMSALLERRSMLIVTVLVLAVALSFTLVGCRRAQPQPSTPTQPTQSHAADCHIPRPQRLPRPRRRRRPRSTTPTQEPAVPPGTKGSSVTVRLYLVRGEKIGVAGRTLPPARRVSPQQPYASSFARPTLPTSGIGLGTTIPAGTTLRGLTIKNGLATVDLSKQFESGGGSLSMQLRVAQVVGTLTQFPTVKRVAFRIDGKPVESIGGEGVWCLRPSPSTTSRTCCPPSSSKAPLRADAGSPTSGSSGRRTSSKPSSTCGSRRAARSGRTFRPRNARAPAPAGRSSS